MTVFWVVVVIQAVCSGILASILADKKGHSEGAWFAAGLFLGVFGLIAAAGLPDTYARRGPRAQWVANFRTCPDCAEPIRMRAKVCMHCGRRFSDEELVRFAIEALDSEDADKRVEGIRVLCEVGGSDVIPHLVKVLSDCPPELWNDLLLKLTSARAVSAVPVLMDALVSARGRSRSREEQVRVVASCCDALAELADASVGEELVGLLKRYGASDSKRRVVQLLGSLRATEHIPELLDIADWHGFLRADVHEAIRDMGPDAISVLQHLLRVTRGRRRKSIQSVLDELTEGPDRKGRETS